MGNYERLLPGGDLEKLNITASLSDPMDELLELAAKYGGANFTLGMIDRDDYFQALREISEARIAASIGGRTVQGISTLST